MKTLVHPTISNSRLMIIITVMLVAVLEVLDGTIVNVALPHMMPALGANSEQITWVLTSYVVASAMVLPLTGLLAKRIGHRRLLLVCILGFMSSSFFCGASTSLWPMLAGRLCQGAFGAAMIPLSQAILRQSFTLAEQGNAMAIWGLGIMVVPVFGPTLGGWIVEHASWRWIFYLNAPVCALGLLLTLLVIKPSEKTESPAIQWRSILYLFVGVGCLQLFLDLGNTHDWLQSNFIVLCLVVAMVGIACFIHRCLSQPNPIIQLRLFRDRNFTLATITLAVYCASFFALITLEPLMLQTLLHYTAISSGNVMAPLGIASAIGMGLSSQLMTRMPVRYLLLAGLTLATAAGAQMAHFSLSVDASHIVVANAMMGLGMGLFMVPLSTYALSTVDNRDITEASGLFSYGRMLGCSIGISLYGTLITRTAQVNWDQYRQSLNPFNPSVQSWAQRHHFSLHDPHAIAQLQATLATQAHFIAFCDAFWMISWMALLLMPLVLLMTSSQRRYPGKLSH